MRVEVALIAVIGLEGCGAAAARGAATPGAPAGAEETLSAPAPSTPEPAAARAPAAANVGYAAMPSSGSSAALPGGSIAADASKPVRAEMLDIEANISIDVEEVGAAAAAIRAAAKNFDAIV